MKAEMLQKTQYDHFEVMMQTLNDGSHPLLATSSVPIIDWFKTCGEFRTDFLSFKTPGELHTALERAYEDEVSELEKGMENKEKHYFNNNYTKVFIIQSLLKHTEHLMEREALKAAQLPRWEDISE